MAGIEKVCEFSGEYPGGLMYGYKRNLIQIMPKYRKLFRGAKARVEIIQVNAIVKFKTGGYTSYNGDPEELQWWVGAKVTKEYWYRLIVEDRNLQGKVEGCYINWTTDIKDVKKRLKRLLRCRNLKVTYNLDYYK